MSNSKLAVDITADFLTFDQPARDDAPVKDNAAWAETLDALLATPETAYAPKRENAMPQVTPRGINDMTMFSAFSERAADLGEVSFYGLEPEDDPIVLQPVDSLVRTVAQPHVQATPASEPILEPREPPSKRKRTNAAAIHRKLSVETQELDKHQLRRIKNRESVEKCRQKRRAVMEQVEASVKHLTTENTSLQKVAEELSQYITEMRTLLAANGVSGDPLLAAAPAGL
eukprot:CAMPEP_0198340128 /NCGR_PEP_ID=MMETSP1450-20131203/42529_1 /TAXON_ID=753684 ORGANISM="Madagascaria erythrocladiodes, Strain CCMP3234" /NCGR_SAMPLE_ID=MMETSP1450 /ASSEMBLY_ACC=CAM_ASM_001115 /LENGTH=228 /DNA_ID=CAMNT_0044045093 /DNA_START=138 /DNA_END=824 /DNA_ORIENTATION=+